MSYRENSIHSSPPQSSVPSRRTHRSHDPSHVERRHRHDHSQSQLATPVPAIPTLSLGAGDIPQSVASPPFRAGPSPGAEPELLPGGGVQIPQGFRFSQPDYGRYRRRDSQNGHPDNARVLGRMGLGVFKGLRKLPAAIVKAGRSYGPRNQESRDMSPVPETDHEAEPRLVERPRMLRESPIQDDVETYMEPEEEEAHAREEQLLYEYIQRKRMTRDRALRKRTRQQTSRSARSVPAPPPENVPPVLVPGAHTPAASPAPSQIDHSQAGHSDTPPPALDAHLEAEQMRREREELEQAQQRERGRKIYAAPPPALDAHLEAEQMRREREELEEAQQRERGRKIYAAEAVRQQFSSVSSNQSDMMHHSSRHHRSASEPRPPRFHSHVFSRWSAERDMAGRRQENRPDEDLTKSSLIARILRFMEQVRDMPWVADRVAADYIPGGVKPKSTSSRYYTTSPGSDRTFTVSGTPLPVRARPPASTPDSKPGGQSWYTQENVLVLPIGVDPPPGFIPYPYPMPGVTVPTEVEGAASASSNTHTETLPSGPAPAPAPAGSSTSGPGYLDGESYQIVPAGGSKSGRPYVFVPMNDGRHQPMVVPGRRKQPAYMYPYPGPPSFAPVAR